MYLKYRFLLVAQFYEKQSKNSPNSHNIQVKHANLEFPLEKEENFFASYNKQH